ncbi:MAG: hypothetical protein E2598_08235 [Sphingobium sp.]|nr:hypothetical protein [Sphingobium sp.]
MAAGMPVEEFSKWCGADPTRPRELLDLIDRKVPDADRFLTIAIKQGVLVDRTYFLDQSYAFLAGETEMERQASINALGQVACESDAEWDRLIAAFTDLQSAEDVIRAPLITAIARQMKDAPEDRRQELAAISIVAVQQLGDYTLDTAARTLAFDPEHSQCCIVIWSAAASSERGVVGHSSSRSSKRTSAVWTGVESAHCASHRKASARATLSSSPSTACSRAGSDVAPGSRMRSPSGVRRMKISSTGDGSEEICLSLSVQPVQAASTSVLRENRATLRCFFGLLPFRPIPFCFLHTQSRGKRVLQDALRIVAWRV